MIPEGRLEPEQIIGVRLLGVPRDVAERQWWWHIGKEHVVVTRLPVTHEGHDDIFDVAYVRVEGYGRKVR